MRCVRGNVDDAARINFPSIVAYGDRGGTFEHERNFNVGMRVQWRALSGFRFDNVSRERSALFIAVELVRHAYKRQLFESQEVHEKEYLSGKHESRKNCSVSGFQFLSRSFQ